MNHEEFEYLDLLQNILSNGSKRVDRTGVGTLSIFGCQLKFSLENNIIPCLTTKKMFVKGVIEELLFFLRGETDTKKLEAKGVNIWKGNTSREFLDKRGLMYLPEGDMGKGYGWQWRGFGKEKERPYCSTNDFLDPGVDQIEQLINGLKNDPYSRRHIITAWNPQQLNETALPPCHCFVQFYVSNDNELSCQFYMRSVDTFLGLPFNFLSYAILTHIIAQAVNMKPKELIFIGGDTHLYLNTINEVKIQLDRSPHQFPTLSINKKTDSVKDIENLSFEDFVISDYKYHPAIKAVMSV